VDGESRELYRRYRATVEGERMARSLRTGVAAVAVLSTLYIPLDWWVYPESFGWMLAVRLGCNAVMAAIFLRTAFRWPLESAIVGSLVCGVMLLSVIGAAGGVTSNYTPGLMLLLLGIPVLLPFSARQATVIVTLLLAGLASLPLFGQPVALDAYLSHLIFPVAAGIESVVACSLLDRLRFNDFRREQDLAEAHAALKQLDVEKSRFTANVHHELRTPLTLMLAPIEAMSSGDFGPLSDVQAGYLRTVHANGLRLLKLINNLLDLAKIEGEQLSVTRRPLHVDALIEELVASARPLAQRKQIALEARGLDGLPLLHADRDALEKVVVNLLGNALKFTESGGRIDVTGAVDAAGNVELTVQDTGVGLPPDQLDRIFDRFAQVDSSNTRRHEGTGIGLALVKELVELHGGRIRAESEGIGRGARMVVTLPIGECDAGVDEEVLLREDGASVALGNSMAAMRGELDHGEALEERHGEALRISEMERNVERNLPAATDGETALTPPPEDAAEILVCEDNADMRRLLRDLIGREFRVRVAASGREGLEQVRERIPDLVLTDVMMPEMSGTELCRALKAEPATRGIPVVLVTSKAEREMKIEGLELGADDYVTKPFHPRELLARVRSLVKLRRLQAELEQSNARLQSTNAELAAALEELRATGVQLVQAERLAAVGELAAGVAHEVNNPMNFSLNALRALRGQVGEVIEAARELGALETVDADAWRAEVEKLRGRLDVSDVGEELIELVGIMEEGLDRTQRLVGDLRDFASPGEGRRADVDLARGLRTTIQLVSHALQRLRVEIHSELPERLPPIVADARALNQVFLNLLKNAAEAMEGEGGNVWVETTADTEEVVVRIRDDGPGIDPETRSRIFEPFFTTKQAGRGTGLGLSISHRIVLEHDGRLEVDSERGRGTTFTVALPLPGECDEA
jgi:signal transduction histidine kinase